MLSQHFDALCFVQKTFKQKIIYVKNTLHCIVNATWLVGYLMIAMRELMQLNLNGQKLLANSNKPTLEKQSGTGLQTPQKSIYRVNNTSITNSPSFGSISALLNRKPVYSGFSGIIADIDENFGNRASKLVNSIRESKYANRLSVNTFTNEVTFIDRTILQKFLYSTRDIFLAPLDFTNYLTLKLKKIKFFDKSKTLDNIYNSKVLKNRRKSNADLDKFYTLSGMFETYTKKYSKLSKGESTEPIQRLLDNITSDFKGESGNFNTKWERALNRLATGFISSIFVGRDFYNIAMMQHNNPESAEKTGKRRQAQEMKRIGLAAFLSYATLGAFAKVTNGSKYAATAVITGTALISEVVARLTSGTPIYPLTSENAQKQRAKLIKSGKLLEDGGAKSFDTGNETTTKQLDFGDINGFAQNIKNGNSGDLKFDILGTGTYANKVSNAQEKQYAREKEDVKKGFKNSLIGIGAFVGTSMLYMAASAKSRNLTRLNSAVSEAFNKIHSRIMTQDYTIKIETVEKTMKALRANGNWRLEQEYRSLIQKADAQSKNGIYTLGKIDSKASKPIKILTYPVKFAWDIISWPAKKVSKIMGKLGQKIDPASLLDEAQIKALQVEKEKEQASKKVVGFFRYFSSSINTLTDSEITSKQFNKSLQDATDFSFNYENSSKQSNKDLAAFSRVFVTAIASYFFINDYRNQVLIESNGKDTQKAKEVTSERSMQKVSNLIMNSMFMMLFNSVLVKVYNSGLLGATAVAMATEVTNETAVRKIIGAPTRKMSKEELEEHEKENYYQDGFIGKWHRAMSTLMGKKPITEKAKAA